MRRVFFPVLLLAVVALLAAACGDGDAEATATSTSSSSATQPAGDTPPPEDTAPDGASSTAASDIVGFQLEDLTIEVGTTVTWTNRDGSAHTATSGSPDSETGLWDSDTLLRDASFSFAFTEPGTFAYFCRFHPGSMRATVTVVADAADAGAMVDGDAMAEGDGTGDAADAGAMVDGDAMTEGDGAGDAADAGAMTDGDAMTEGDGADGDAMTDGDATGGAADAGAMTDGDAMTPQEVASRIANSRLEDLTVAVGTTVTWTNNDGVPHTATAGVPNSQTGVFDTGLLTQGQSGSFTFTELGTFAYFCMVHPSMQATVTVTAEGSSEGSGGADPVSQSDTSGGGSFPGY